MIIIPYSDLLLLESPCRITLCCISRTTHTSYPNCVLLAPQYQAIFICSHYFKFACACPATHYSGNIFYFYKENLSWTQRRLASLGLGLVPNSTAWSSSLINFSFSPTTAQGTLDAPRWEMSSFRSRFRNHLTPSSGSYFAHMLLH